MICLWCTIVHEQFSDSEFYNFDLSKTHVSQSTWSDASFIYHWYLFTHIALQHYTNTYTNGSKQLHTTAQTTIAQIHQRLLTDTINREKYNDDTKTVQCHVQLNLNSIQNKFIQYAYCIFWINLNNCHWVWCVSETSIHEWVYCLSSLLWPTTYDDTHIWKQRRDQNTVIWYHMELSSDHSLVVYKRRRDCILVVFCRHAHVYSVQWQLTIAY